MIGTTVRSCWTHLKVRAGASVRSLAAWSVLLVFGLTGLVYWPAESGAFNPLKDPREGLPLLLTWFLWYWLWTATPIMVVRGRAASPRGDLPLGICASPTLPVGLRTRAVAEALLAVTVLAVVRWLAVSVFQGSWSFATVLTTAAGAFMLLPMAVAWALPVKNPSGFMARPFFVALLAAVLEGVGGVFDNRLGIVLGGLSLTLVALLIAGVEAPAFPTGVDREGADHRAREGLKPGRRLTYDALTLPLKGWGLWVFFSIVIYGICLLFEVRGSSLNWILFAGFEAFLIIALQPLFRPFNSNLLAESLVGKHQVSRGDFLKAWSVLPVTRESVLRKVWIHGLLVGFMVWAVPVVMLILRYRLVEGRWSLIGGIGNLTQFVVVGGLLILVVAGLMVAVASGRKLEYAMSGLCLLLGVHVLFLVKIVLLEVFGRGSLIAEAGPVVTLIVLVVIGSVPPLRFLFKAPEVVE